MNMNILSFSDSKTSKCPTPGFRTCFRSGPSLVASRLAMIGCHFYLLRYLLVDAVLRVCLNCIATGYQGNEW